METDLNPITRELSRLSHGEAILLSTSVTRQGLHQRLKPLRDLGFLFHFNQVPGGFLITRGAAVHPELMHRLRGVRKPPPPAAPPISVLDLL